MDIETWDKHTHKSHLKLSFLFFYLDFVLFFHRLYPLSHWLVNKRNYWIIIFSPTESEANFHNLLQWNIHATAKKVNFQAKSASIRLKMQSMCTIGSNKNPTMLVPMKIPLYYTMFRGITIVYNSGNTKCTKTDFFFLFGVSWK